MTNDSKDRILPRASDDDQLAGHGPRLPDRSFRTVEIPIRVVEGRIVAFGRSGLPALKDCIGELIVPAFAVKSPSDLEWLTRPARRQLFEPGTMLLCRVSGRHVPAKLLPRCVKINVPDAGVPGAFVEVKLSEALFLVERGTKRSVLEGVKCTIPSLDDREADSLNEAYRIISEVFEPTRRSRGGNVFRSVYSRRANGAWRPIGELRGDIVFEPR